MILASPTALAGLAMVFLFTTANETVNLIFGVWMEVSFELRLAALSVVAIGIGVAEFTREALVGGLVDRLGKARAVSIGLGGNCLASLVLVVSGKNLVAGLAGLFLFYLTFEFTLVSSIPLMSEAQPAARATLLPVNISCGALARAFGAWLAPWLFEQKLALAPFLGFAGISVNAIAAILLNILSLLALEVQRPEARAARVAAGLERAGRFSWTAMAEIVAEAMDRAARS